MLKEKDKERFYNSFTRQPNGCWEWNRYKDANGVVFERPIAPQRVKNTNGAYIRRKKLKM